MNSEDAFLQPIPVAQASADVRSRFIVRTYNHLFGAIALFTLIEIALFKSGVADRIASALMGNWLLVLGGFMDVLRYRFTFDLESDEFFQKLSMTLRSQYLAPLSGNMFAALTYTRLGFTNPDVLSKIML